MEYRFSARTIDQSHAVLKDYYSLGYRRVQFSLSENHPKADICDNVYSRYGLGGGSFIQLTTLINKAPVFGSNPPAPLYGMTHPECRCSFVVFPPKNINDLTIPGRRMDIEEKKVLLATMYPIQVGASSSNVSIINYDFDKYIDERQRKPVYDDTLKEEPWYDSVWNFIKTKIFKKSNNYLEFIRYADSDGSFKFMDQISLVSDIEVQDFLTVTKIPSGEIGIFLSNYEYSNSALIYFIRLNRIYPVSYDRLASNSNSSLDSELGKKVVFYDSVNDDQVECVVIRHLLEERKYYCYSPYHGKVVVVDEEKIKIP